MKTTLKHIAFFLLLGAAALSAYAQPGGSPLGGKDSLVLTNTREMGLLDVDKPALKPPVQKLEKPKIDDLRFNSQDVFIPTNFQAQPPEALPLTTPKPEDLKNSFIKLGIGRFITPFGQVYVHNGRDKRVDMGLNYKHQSVYQDVVPLRKFNENSVSGTLATSDNEQTIRANVDFYRRGYFFFADTVLEATPDAREDSLRMAFSELNANVRLFTNFDPERALHYDLGVGTRIYSDRRTNREFQLGITPGVSYQIVETAKIGINSEIAFVRGDLGDSTQNRIFIDLNPYVQIGVGDFRLNAGIRFNHFNNSQDTATFTNLGPAVELSYAIDPTQFEVFAGFTSGMGHTTFGAMRRENPYLNDYQLIRPVITRFNVFLGARGNIGGELDYNARLYFRQVRNQLIYTAPLGGFYFDAVYDSLMNIPGAQVEVNYRKGESIRAGATLNFNVFNPSTVERYFHASPIRLDVYGSYVWEKKLNLRGELNVFGPAPVAIDSLGDAILRSPFVNIGLHADYRITDQFSVFASVNNLLSTQFQRWYNYFERPIDFNAGLTVTF